MNVELPGNSNADKVLSAHSTPAVNTEDNKILIEVSKHYVTPLQRGCQQLVYGHLS